MDGAPSALLKLMPTAGQSCLPASAMESSSLSQSGMTLEPSTADAGAGLLMSLAADSPAKTSLTLEVEVNALDSMEVEADCGAKWRESSRKLSQPSSSSRTARKSEAWVSTSCFKTLLAWGSIVRGILSQQERSEHHTKENVSGVWLITPDAHMNVRKGFRSKTPNLSELVGGRNHANPQYLEWMMGWPIDWTDLQPLAMDKFQQWLSSHGKR